jgi:aryl carrier-like protein
MVPAHFVILERLPLTPNGKLDRKSLPAPDGPASIHAYVAPRTSTEAALAALWQQVLGLPQVGIHDNFFELGGHSLLAVKLVDQMRQSGVTIDVRTLFTSPTIAALAELTGHTSAPELTVPPNLIPPSCRAITPQMLPLISLSEKDIQRIAAEVPGGMSNIQDIYPLVPLQEGVLFHHLMGHEGDPYLLPALLAFDTRARLDAFLQALQQVIQRHDILRTAVLWQGLPSTLQVVWRVAILPVEQVKIPSDADVATELARRFDPRHYRLDVRRAPLIGAFIAHDAPKNRWLLGLLSHHLATDHTTL